MKILGIVVARRGSERLPGKVLRELAGKPMLMQVLARAARASCLHDLVVALPDDKQDDAIEALCVSSGYFCFRGSEPDLLDRVYRTAIAYGADVVIPLRANSPLMDGGLIDQAVETLDANPNADWVTNRLPKPTFPQGLEVEAIRIEALRRAWTEDSHPGSRQHLESVFLRRPDLFNAAYFSAAADHSRLLWQVLTLPDLDRVRRVFESFGDRYFAWQEALPVWHGFADEAPVRDLRSGITAHSTPFEGNA